MFSFLKSLFDANTPRALVRAAKAGDLQKVGQLLDAGVPVDSRAEQVFPLFGAAFYGHLEVVRLLRQRGARLDVMLEEHTSALHALVQIDASAEMCEALLDGATDVDHSTNGLTPLMLACQFNRKAMVEALLARGADVNAVFPQSMTVEPLPGDLKGFTPLVFALQNGHDDLVPVLLEAGASLGARLAHGVTELMIAATASGPVAIEALVGAGADPNESPSKGTLAGLTPLMIACALPGGLKRANPLELALFCTNRINVVRALLSGGADGEATDPNGKSARDLAKASGLLELGPDLFD